MWLPALGIIHLISPDWLEQMQTFHPFSVGMMGNLPDGGRSLDEDMLAERLLLWCLRHYGALDGAAQGLACMQEATRSVQVLQHPPFQGIKCTCIVV